LLIAAFSLSFVVVVVGILDESDASKTSDDAADEEDGADSSRVTSSGEASVPFGLLLVGVLTERVEEGVEEGTTL